MSGPAGPASSPGPDDGPDDGAPNERAPGWRDVLLVSAGVVVVVLGAAVATGFLPTDLQRLVFHEPLLIGFLILGTIVVLLGVARRRPPVA